MTPEFPEAFAQHYDCLLKRLKLHGLQPKTIALYSHGVRRAGAYFAYQIDALSREQLTDYFVHVVEQLSLEHALAQFVWFEVLLRTCIAKTLARCGSSEAAQTVETAGYRHGGTCALCYARCGI